MLRLVRSALDALLPRRCATCRRGLAPAEARAICSACWDTIPRISGPRCAVCGVPFASEAATSESPTHRCGPCRESPPAFTQALAAGRYEGPLAEAIRRCKYHRQVVLIPVLAELLHDVVDALPPVDGVLPVPLHPRRLRRRQFNQALRLAAEVAHRLSKPLWPDLLRRVRPTSPQTTLDRAHRQANVRRAFSVRPGRSLAGLRVLLVDDVYTTGATANECAKTLRGAGASDVYVVTVARLP